VLEELVPWSVSHAAGIGPAGGLAPGERGSSTGGWKVRAVGGLDGEEIAAARALRLQTAEQHGSRREAGKKIDFGHG
jgi:hypothetical protein